MAAVSLGTRAAAPTSPQGVITDKIFLNIGGGVAITDLRAASKFPDKPDMIRYEPYFEMWATGDINTAPPGDVLNNYGAQLLGYFYPDTTGDYTFYIASDDFSELYLSTDETPANKHIIAMEPAWNNPRTYTATDRRNADFPENNSSTWKNTKWPTGNKITLTKGKAYYIEVLFKEGGGGDNVSVSLDGNLPIPGSMLSSFDKASGPVTIATQPAAATVGEGTPASFSVEANGTPPYTYQWLKGGTAIPNATNQVFSLTRTAASDAGSYTVKVTGPAGSATSNPAVLTVTSDTTAPTIVSAHASSDFKHVIVTFSEPVSSATGGNAANFKINGLTVSAAAVRAAPSDNIVDLTTSQQTQGANYTLTVNGVKDISAAGNTIAANSTSAFTAWDVSSGFLLWEYWGGIGGTAAQALKDDSRFQAGVPDSVGYLAGSFDSRTIFPDDSHDNYGAKISGWITPTETADYDFFIRSDDASQLFLSSNATFPNVDVDTPIAEETGCCNAFQEPGASQTTAAPIHLVAGTKYAVIALVKEGGGGDFVQVAWRKSTDTTTAGNLQPIPGKYLSTFADPTGATIDITTQPASTQAQEGHAATFTVKVNASSPNVAYQWKKNGVDISGATKSSLSTPVLTLADSGAKYSVQISIPGKSVLSSEATLTVVPDTFAPVVVNAGSIGKGSNIELGVGFDEAIDEASAGAAANYSLSKGAVSKVRVQKFDKPLNAAAPVTTAGGVVLETTGLAAGDTVTVTIKGVKDLKGNAIPAAGVAKTVKITSTMKWVAVGGTDYTQGHLPDPAPPTDPALWPDDVVAVNTDKDFDLISGGSANWNNYDEMTFVYESITGDFDRVVRVEYQDPSSQWARAGLQARKALDENVTRDQVDGGYMMAEDMLLRVNPAVQWNGAAGNNAYEFIFRDADGGNYGGGGGGIPAYPNAWMRLKREGQTFTGYRSTDGQTWTQVDNPHTFPTDTPMPNTLFVGPYFAPELSNNGSAAGIGHAVVAKFRDYGPFTATAVGGIQSITLSGANVTITFTGSLEESDSVSGPWSAVTGSSPLTVNAKSKAAHFYRVKK